MTPKQRKLTDKIKDLGRLLTEEEIIDHYIENNTRGTCAQMVCGGGKTLTFENRLWEVKNKAMMCYTYALGRLVISGYFKLPKREA